MAFSSDPCVHAEPMEVTNPINGRVSPVALTPYCRTPWTLVQDTGTGFVFLLNPPSYESLESDMAWEKTFAKERERRLHDEPFLARVSLGIANLRKRLWPRRKKILDVAMREVRQLHRHGDPLKVVDIGCGRGDLLMLFQSRLKARGSACSLFGIELSKGLAAAAQERIGEAGRVIQASALDGAKRLERDSVDLTLMSCFLEHEARPLELLRELRLALRAHGSIVIKVPNFACWNRRLRGPRWCGFRYPDHVNYFTPHTLGLLAREAGYEVRPQKLIDRVPVSDNMYMVIRPREERA
ncbi:MAG: class I SAM-dependent methyltransferase [Planctomycetota bacterium]